jgi:hypothetical protein
VGLSWPWTLAFAVAGVVAFSLGKNEGNWLPFLAFVVVTGTSWAISSWLHPQRACWTCRGKGRHFGFVWTYASRACSACGGSGRVDRFGTRIFGKPR